MNYDKISFLAGLAVGQKLKGWGAYAVEVASGGGGEAVETESDPYIVKGIGFNRVIVALEPVIATLESEEDVT